MSVTVLVLHYCCAVTPHARGLFISKMFYPNERQS